MPQSWLNGARMLVRTGTTSVADIEAVPELLPEVWAGDAAARVLVSGNDRHQGPSPAAGHCSGSRGANRLRSRASAVAPGLSPHAPYSTVPELLRLSAQTARRRKWRLTTHVAESALEFEMFARGRGEMFDWLQRSGRDMSDCGLGSPVQHLERCGALSERLLAAHANYLGKQDAALLAKRKVHVVHCPRCHFYFRHDPFPLRRLAQGGSQRLPRHRQPGERL